MTGIPEDQDWDAYPPGTAPAPELAPHPRPHPYQYAPAHGSPPAHGPPPGYPQSYGPPPGYPPAYGPPSGHGYGWYPLPPPAWPDGPGRPSVATAAAVLGFVTAGLTIAVSGAVLIGVILGEDDAVSVLLTLGLPCAAGLIAGGLRLQTRRSPALLFGSAIGCAAVLAMVWVAGALTIDRSDGLEGLSVFVVAALVLPVLTAVFAWLPVVRGWAAAGAE